MLGILGYRVFVLSGASLRTTVSHGLTGRRDHLCANGISAPTTKVGQPLSHAEAEDPV